MELLHMKFLLFALNQLCCRQKGAHRKWKEFKIDVPVTPSSDTLTLELFHFRFFMINNGEMHFVGKHWLEMSMVFQIFWRATDCERITITYTLLIVYLFPLLLLLIYPFDCVLRNNQYYHHWNQWINTRSNVIIIESNTAIKPVEIIALNLAICYQRQPKSVVDTRHIHWPGYLFVCSSSILLYLHRRCEQKKAQTQKRENEHQQ